MLLFCRNLHFFKCWCISDHQNFSRHTSPNTYYIWCVFHCTEASKIQVLPQLLMSTKQIPIYTVDLRWNGHHWKFFTCFFTDKFDAVNHAIQLEKFSNCIYVWKWTIQRWNLSSRISGTRFKFLNIVSKSDHTTLAGRCQVWGPRLTMLPCWHSPTLLQCC